MSFGCGSGESLAHRGKPCAFTSQRSRTRAAQTPSVPKAYAGAMPQGATRGRRVLSADCLLEAGADERALGAAVTVALCGHWEHEGPCRWPHHTEATTRADGVTHVRTVVTLADRDEADVRRRFRAALAAEELTGPDGRVSRWRLL